MWPMSSQGHDVAKVITRSSLNKSVQITNALISKALLRREAQKKKEKTLTELPPELRIMPHQ